MTDDFKQLAEELIEVDNVVRSFTEKRSLLVRKLENIHDNEITDAVFWKLIERLKTEMDRCPDNTERAVDCFAYDAIGADYDLLAFVKEFNEKATRVHKLRDLWETIDVSDDGWTDFCDSVFLNGKDVFDGLINGTITGKEDDFKASVKWGEFYIALALDRSLEKRLPYLLVNQLHPEKSPFDDPKEKSPADLLESKVESLEMEVIKLKKKLDSIKSIL